MENSYLVYSVSGEAIQIERFHICTWEFKNHSALIEFGMEINSISIENINSLNLILFIPWLNSKCKISDFYSRLSDVTNSRFIFNDSVINTSSIDGGLNKTGVIHQFSERNEICILPIDLNNNPSDKRIEIRIDLHKYNSYLKSKKEKPNVYVRFSVTPDVSYISTRKDGITKSTILYDIKLNEKRNIPTSFLSQMNSAVFCEIQTCFCFNIVPNSYDLVFFDSTSLQNVRTLEYDAFNRYLEDKRVENDELIVIFSKKKRDNPFSFFAIYSKERIGAGQIAVAILVNFISGVFLFLPSVRQSHTPTLTLVSVWKHLPLEIYIALFISLITLIFFAKPTIVKIWKGFKRKFNL